MSVSSHVSFEQPLDTNSVIWRYMDFTKFVELLDSSSLYFARSDKLGDPFEGSSALANVNGRAAAFSGIPGHDPENLAAFRGMLNKNDRFETFVNCWHMNDGESAAMWKLYAQTTEAIAIQSTYAKLANALSDDVFLGVVKYIDFHKDTMPDKTMFDRYMHKRLSFMHEHEVRAITRITLPFDSNGELALSDAPLGIPKVISLDEIIDAIYVAPTSRKWFQQLTERVCKTYRLSKPVHRSSLETDPVF